jgi:hypothetical protein
MDLDRFLNLLAATMGAMGSLYVLKGLAGLSPHLIERLSRTYFDFSSAQINALTAQKADSIVGIILVLVAFCLAAATLALVPMGRQFVDSHVTGVAVVGTIATCTWLILHWAAKWIKSRQKLAVGMLITRQGLEQMLESGRLGPHDAHTLRVYSETLLNMKVHESEAPEVLFERLAKRVGMSIQADFWRLPK